MALRASFLPPQRWGYLLILLTMGSIAAVAQDCYYPNGDISPNDSPCSKNGGACCPLNWECLSNGLCYLQNEDYYERHTCTDQTWEDSNCPHMCTYDYTAAGNEAILLCDPDNDESWCCDANRVSFNCCTKSGATTFSAPFGTQVAMISLEPSSKSSLSVKTTSSSSSKDSQGSTTSSSSTTSETTTSSSKTSTSPSSSSPSTSTAIITAITSDAHGQVSTLISTKIITTAASASSSTGTPTPETARKRKLPVILGVSIGVPLGLIAGAILLYIFRRRQKHEASTTTSTTARAPNTDVYFPPDATNLPTTYEKAELDSHSTSFAEKQQHQKQQHQQQQHQQQHNIPSELEATSPNLNPPSNPPSSVSPLTSSHDTRWSAVSSLSPQTNRFPSSFVGESTALGLQAIGQQHYGSGQHHLYRPVSAPESAGASAPQYRPYRPPGIQQQEAIELAGSNVPAGQGSGDSGGSSEQETKKDERKSDTNP